MDHDLTGHIMTPELVIFDCDGVLVDTETKTSIVMSANFARYGLKIDAADIHEMFIGGTMVSAGQEAERRGAVLPSNWLKEISDEVISELEKGVVVFDGLLELLDELESRDVRTAVASNGPMEKMEVSLGPSGLWQRFEGRIYSGRVYQPKPSQEMLIRAVKDTKSDPNLTVMIDDTTAGINAAIAAGVQAIGFAEASDASLLTATGYPVAHSMSEVRALLNLTI